MSNAKDDTTKRLKMIFDAENVVIIAPQSESEMEVCTKSLKEKWQKTHPNGSISSISWSDFTSEDSSRRPEIKEGTKIYILAHHQSGTNVIDVDDGTLSCEELSKKLVDYISDKHVVVNLVSCGAGRAGEEASSTEFFSSFGSRLHQSLKSAAKRDIPVVARDQVVEIWSPSGIKKTYPLHYTYSQAAAASSDASSEHGIHHQEGSKRVFITDDATDQQIAIDAYAMKLKLSVSDEQGRTDYNKLAETNLTPSQFSSVIYHSSPEDIEALCQCLREDTAVSKKFSDLLIATFPIGGGDGLKGLIEFSPSLLSELCKYSARNGDDAFRSKVADSFFEMHKNHINPLHFLMTGGCASSLSKICAAAVKSNDLDLLVTICNAFLDVENDTTALYRLAKTIGLHEFHPLIESALSNDTSQGANLFSLIESLDVRNHEGLTVFDQFKKSPWIANPDKLLNMIFKAMESTSNSNLEDLVRMTSDVPTGSADIKGLVRARAEELLAKRQEVTGPRLG